MRRFATLISNLGGFFMGLSDRSRLQIVLLGLLLLGGGSIYKLIVNIQALDKPIPAATPEQLIKPMEQLFKQTSSEVSTYRMAKDRDMKKLDSLAKIYSNQNTSKK